MITEKEVTKAIEECLQDPITGNKRAVLADLIIIQDYLFGELTRTAEPQYMSFNSYSAPQTEQVETYVETNGDSEFLKAVDGKRSDRLWRLMDEFVKAVKILHPKMYSAFIDTIQDL